jgi:beta-aspartyl-peptidase (threonine type)
MKTYAVLVLVLLMHVAVVAADEPIPNVVLAVHGGIGLPRKDVSPELEKQLRAKLAEALATGYQTLEKPDTTSLDAVEQAIRILEDSPLFNAGKGSVFTHDGRNELDASIMNGETLAAGAVAEVTTVKNPISAARAVMEKSPHVLMIGKGAETFAEKAGLEIVDPSYFWTLPRWKQLQDDLEREQLERTRGKQSGIVPSGHPWGTVGAVAVDQRGNLAAGTSTGGMSNKLYGRLGGVPIIGAGTYADNTGCAVSGTGHGEFFIRYTVAHDVSALKKYRGLSVAQAADEVIQRKMKPAGGEGGIIVLDAKNNFTMSFNTEGMYRGYIARDGRPHVFLFEN